MNKDKQPIASILEAAYLGGFRTGLVATSRITHATPAAYCAHVPHRILEDDIASQQIGYKHPLGKIVHLLMGGGRRHYLPQALNGTREDDLDLITWATENGTSYASSKSDLDKYTQQDGKVPLPFLGLFAPSHMAFELDRHTTTEPSLLEMSQVAIRTLHDATSSSDSEKGYFIMIEASRIDHAGHNNDIAAHVHDTVMYNAVMAWLKEHVSQHPDTQLLSAADHETGGITLTTGYKPAALAKPTLTRERLEPKLEAYNGANLHENLRSTILPAYGFANASEGDIARYVRLYEADGASKMTNTLVHDFAASMGVQWSTDEHSAVDVTLYGFAAGEAYAEMRASLGRNVDNTMLATYVEGVLGVSLENTTAALRASGLKWAAGGDDDDDDDDDDGDGDDGDDLEDGEDSDDEDDLE
jgi:alkaline phosphatase